MTIKKIKDSTGQEHAIDYNALENRPIATSSYQYITLSSLNSKETQEIDLSHYLPNDGCNYLVSVQVLGGVTSGTVNAYGSTDIVTDPYSYCFFRITGTSSKLLEGGQCQMLVGPGRKIYIYNSGNGNSAEYTVRLAHYIRVS